MTGLGVVTGPQRSLRPKAVGEWRTEQGAWAQTCGGTQAEERHAGIWHHLSASAGVTWTTYALERLKWLHKLKGYYLEGIRQ